MNVLAGSGHDYSKCCIVGNWTCFSFLGDVWPLVQEASSLLTNWRGVGRLLNAVWECPYRVLKDTCELWVVRVTRGMLVQPDFTWVAKSYLSFSLLLGNLVKMPFYKPKDCHMQTLIIPLFVKILKTSYYQAEFSISWMDFQLLHHNYCRLALQVTGCQASTY